jgi:twitching motility protein PilU
MDLSSNLRSIISQRLIPREDGKGRKAAIEILLNTPTVADRIFAGEFNEILSIMEKSRELGMRTFDWSLFGLYNEGHISYEEAIANAESANGLRLNIKLRSARGEPTAGLTGLNLALHEVKDSPEADEQAVREDEMRRQAETRRKRLEQLHDERQKQLQMRHRREDEHLEILRKHHVPGGTPPTPVKTELSLMPDPAPPTRPPSQELSLVE